MTMQGKRQVVAENAAELAGLGLRPQQVAALQKLARQLQRYHVDSCNYGLSPQQERNEAAREREVTAIRESAGIHVRVQGDPRGWPILVSREAIQANDTLRAGIVRVCPY